MDKNMCNVADLYDLAKLIGHKRGQVHIPWIRLAQDQEDFIHGDYRPELITIAEPTRMRLGEKKTLIEFWLKRQNDDSVEHAFLFRAYPSGDDWIAHDYCGKRMSGAQDIVGKKDKMKSKDRKKETKNTQSHQGRRTSLPSSEASGDESSDSQYADEEDMDVEDRRPTSRAVGNLVAATRKGKEKASWPTKKEARKRLPERIVAHDVGDAAEFPMTPDKGQGSKQRVRRSPEEASEDGDVSTDKPSRRDHLHLARKTLKATTSPTGSRAMPKNTPEKSMGEPEWGRQPPTVERLKTAGRSSDMGQEEISRQGLCIPDETWSGSHVEHRASQACAESHHDNRDIAFSGH
jgi:hypothetical protein